MKPLQRLLLPAILCWMALSTHANNLSITSLSVNQTGGTGGTVTFTVGWNNCWNLGTVAAPNNWDGVWLFVKFRNCSASPAVPFTHGTLTYSGSTIPSAYQAMTSLPQSSYYTAGGSTPVSGALDDPNGIMLVPTTAGTQSSISGTVTLAVSNLPSNATTVTVEVVGIEMVYVPQGPYYLGDGSTNGSYYHFCASTTGVASALIAAANETATSSYYYVNGTGSTGSAYAASVPAAWPKGYYAFYCMKYEITEDLYTQFLNTIGSSNAAAHWIANSGTNRNQASQVNSYTFADARPYRAQNWLSWSDWEAVLDWACLRPMTELEFEKACRGGSSTVGNGAEQNEYPWQNTSITPATTFSGAENGTETFTNANANCVVANYSAYSGGDGGQGPVRAGIFATATSTQQTSGATYYGIMEMGGDLREFVVQMTTAVANDTFTRVVGDGILATANGPGNLSLIGDANAPTWPAEEGAVGAGGIGTQCYGQRGGDWYTGSSDYPSYSYDPVQTSSRYNCYVNTTGQYTYMYYYGQTRGSINGGRGVR